MTFVDVVIEDKLNAKVPHCVNAVGFHVEIAVAPPAADCADVVAMGADALILFPLVGMLGAVGGASEEPHIHARRPADIRHDCPACDRAVKWNGDELRVAYVRRNYRSPENTYQSRWPSANREIVDPV